MDTQAGAIMTRDVITAGPYDTVTEVARILSERGISAVPVCEKDGTLVGMISEGDLLRPFGRQHSLKRDWWLGLLADGLSLAPDFLEYVREDHHPAKDLMTKDVITVDETTPLAEAADVMMEHKVKRLPVLRGGKIVGIVSRADLVRAFYEAKSLAEILVAALIFAAVSCFPLSAARAEPGSADAGQMIAQTWCSNCHLVGPQASGSSGDSVPSFASVAKMSSTTSLSIHAFLQTSHGQMPDLALNRNQIDDVTAYVLSLKPSR